MSFRNDRDALASQNDELLRANASLRAEVGVLRGAYTQPSWAAQYPASIYERGPGQYSPAERVMYSRHGLTTFPPWLLGILGLFTFGFVPLLVLSLQHDRLPRAASDDPSSGRAIGFSFIPYFHLYWHYFNAVRLTDRVNLQFRLRGLPDGVSRSLVATTAVLGVIPYLNILTIPILWTVTAMLMQRAMNQAAAMAPVDAAQWGQASQLESSPVYGALPSGVHVEPTWNPAAPPQWIAAQPAAQPAEAQGRQPPMQADPWRRPGQ